MKRPLQVIVLLVLLPRSVTAELVHWPATDGGNDHWYELVENPVFWEQAFADATTRTPPVGYKAGHLVTITDAAENSFLTSHFVTATRLGAWAGFTDSAVEGEWRWIDNTPGIWQDPDNFANPSQTAYTNWIPSEPNDFMSGEDYLLISFELGYFPGQWNDGRGPGAGPPSPSPCIYVVEYEPVPEPSSLLVGAVGSLMVSGFVGIRALKRSRRR